MSSEWVAHTVEEIAASTSAAMATGPFGSSISAKYFVDSGVPVIRGSNLSPDTSTRLIEDGLVFITAEKAGEFDRSTARRGDLIFTCWGTINQVGLIDSRATFDRYVVSNKQMKLTVDPMKADPRFIYYVFSGPDKQAEILDNGIGSSVPGFNLGQLKRHEILLPSLIEQRAIADFLESLDDRITLLRETNATLEAIAQALFKSWFVDFDPVCAKRDSRPPEGIDEATAAVFPDSLEEWCEGLRTATARELIAEGALQIGDGYRAKNEELGAPGVPFVRAGDLVQGQITPTKDLISLEFLPRALSKSAKVGDTAFTSKGTIGRFAFVDASAGTAIYSPQICFWRSTDQRTLHPIYLHFWMKSPAFADQVAAVSGQAAIMEFVSLSDQRAMRVALPPIEIQSAYAAVVAPLLERIALNRATAASFIEIRDTLLPRLISGQLRLPANIEEALA